MVDSNINDSTLASMVKNGNDSSALSELIDRHSGVCFKIYNKYFYKNTSSTAKDVQDQKDSLIYHAAKTYDPTCGTKFSTWLGNVVTYACLNACNEKKRELSVDDEVLNHLIDTRSSSQLSILKRDKDLLHYIEEIIDMSNDETAKEVIKMRYLSNSDKVKTFKEIADHFGVSTQTIVNWHDKFISLLRNKLKSEATVDIL